MAVLSGERLHTNMDKLLPGARSAALLWQGAALAGGLALGAGVSRTTLVLAGLAVSGMLTAGMNTIKLLYPDAIAGASDFLVGGLSGVTLSGLKGAVLYLITGTLLALLLAADLNVLCLGEQSAASLGLHIGAVRFLGILAAALLACGPVQWFWMKWKGRVLAQDGSVTVTSWIGYMAILWFSILLLVNNTYNPFIYFRF